MLNKLVKPKKEDVCPNCGTACFETDILCPHCGKNLDELFEQLPDEEINTKPSISIPDDYKLLLQWLPATIIGFVLGEVYLTWLTFDLVPLSLLKNEFDWFGIMLGVAAGVATGFSVGFFQWLVLKKYSTHNWLWVLATFIGVTSGNFTEGLIVVLTRNHPLTYIFTGSWVVVKLVTLFIAGLEIGLIQKIVLQKFLSKTWIWAITVAISWTLATVVGNDIIYPIFYPPVEGGFIEYMINPCAEIIIHGTSGMVFGIITGILLLWLFKQNHIFIQKAD